ncbi:hypothetical protein R9X47_24555 [Wukongibacter baidiensis]|uniref:hypothetical protein n=1 Tax=Wukongibacter baidiensis TaxID=1723361 RepID=UPI003D7F9D88
MLKKSKLMKGILVTTLVVSLLVPTFAFANEEGEPASERNGIFKEMKEKYSDVDHGRLLAIVEMYAEGDLADWEAMFEERAELKEELKVLREEIKEMVGDKKGDKKEEIAAYREELMAKVEAEEMTKEEAKEELKSYIEELKGDFQEKKEEWKAEKQEKKELWEAKREEMKELRKSLVDAAKEDDADTANEILDEMFEMYENHTEWVKEKIAFLEERLAENQ